MYISVPPPPPPPGSKPGTVAVMSPDAVANMYQPLQGELQTPGDVTGSTNSSTVVGLGCAGGKCSCGGSCKNPYGMGLFDSGTDISGWGIPEWGLIGLGGFALWSMFSTTRSGVKAVRKTYRRRSATAARKKRLEEQLAAL